MAKSSEKSVSKSGGGDNIEKSGGPSSLSPTSGSSSWFDEVTGTNDYERQSWRDNFNEGRAAGDLTGATNARLDRERAENFGATQSGSSTQLSAAEVRDLIASLPERVQSEMRGATPDLPQQAVVGAAQGQAPQTPRAVSGAVVGAFQSGWGPAMAPEVMDLVLNGFDWRANPRMSNAEDAETRYSDIGGNILGVATMGSDIGHNLARMYFGDRYMEMGPQQRLGILGNHAQEIVKESAISLGNQALGAFFGGMTAIEEWGERNKRVEDAMERARQESNAAWDLRMELQAEEARKAEEPKWSGNVVVPPTVW